jgi:hypothetical protein
MLASMPSRRKMTSVAGKSSPVDALVQIRMGPWLDDGTLSVYLAPVTGAPGWVFLIVDDGLVAQLGVRAAGRRRVGPSAGDPGTAPN